MICVAVTAYSWQWNHSNSWLSLPDKYVCVCAQSLSHVWVFATPGTVTHQASLPMEISRQEYWRELPFPTPGNLSNPGIQLESCISCIGRQILYHCITWEALPDKSASQKLPTFLVLKWKYTFLFFLWRVTYFFINHNLDIWRHLLLFQFTLIF